MSMSPKGSRNGAEFSQKHDTMASNNEAKLSSSAEFLLTTCVSDGRHRVSLMHPLTPPEG